MHLFLVGRIRGKKYDFCETAMRKRSITNSANDFVSPLNNGKGSGIIVINKTSDVLPGHFGKLLLEQSFQSS